MPPRDPSLPEGTDHIIDTNIDLGDPGSGGGGGGSGGSGGGATGGLGGGTSTGTSGGSGTPGGSAFQFDKQKSGDGGDSVASGITGQIRDQFASLKGQAGERARGLADDGKRQATTFLQTIASIVEDAAGSVEERLGSQYSGFGQRASGSINSLASTLDERSVDDLINEARTFVQRSPAVAIGIAAVVGFAVARVVRSSVAEVTGQGQNDGPGGVDTGGTDIGTTRPTGGAGGLNATSGAFGETGTGTAGNVGGSGTSSGPGSTGAGGSAPTY